MDEQFCLVMVELGEIVNGQRPIIIIRHSFELVLEILNLEMAT